MENDTALLNIQAHSLYQLCEKLPDCRLPQGIRHRYASILTIAFAGILSGACSYLEIGEWAQSLTVAQLKKLGVRRQGYKYLAPSESTLRRTLQRTNPKQLDQILGAWVSANLPEKYKALACDGKWLKGSNSKGRTIKLMAALTHDSAVVVSQTSVPDGTHGFQYEVQLSVGR
jgi:hypothetical protein